MRGRNLMVIATLSSMMTIPSFAQAACTQQDAMAKGMQLSQLLQTKMAQDPANAQVVMGKMQPVMQSYQSQMMSGGVVDWDKVCTEYDDLIKQAK